MTFTDMTRRGFFGLATAASISTIPAGAIARNRKPKAIIRDNRIYVEVAGPRMEAEADDAERSPEPVIVHAGGRRWHLTPYAVGNGDGIVPPADAFDIQCL